METIEYEGKEYPVLRNTESVYETILLEMRHRVHGHVARIIGMSHAAQPAFYKTISDLISERPNSLILTEGIRFPKETDQECSMEVGADNYLAIENIVEELTNGEIVAQKNALEFPSERIHPADVSFNKFIKTAERLGETDCFDGFGFSLEIYGVRLDCTRLFEWLLRTPVIRGLIKNTMQKALIEEFQTLANGYGDSKDVVMLSRNQHLLELIRKLSFKHDLEIPWGVAHVPGIVSGLREKGKWNIVRDSIRYIPFFDLSKFAE